VPVRDCASLVYSFATDLLRCNRTNENRITIIPEIRSCGLILIATEKSGRNQAANKLSSTIRIFLRLVTVGSSATEGMAILRNDARQAQVPTQRSVETENSAFQPEAQRPVRISIENCVNKDGSRPRKTRQCRVFGKIQGGKRGNRVDYQPDRPS
jgi:hypothetical protein